VLDRSEAAADIRALCQAERRSLQVLGVRFGAFSLFLPSLLRPEALTFNAAFAPAPERSWAPAPSALTLLPHPAPSARALARRGLRAAGPFAAPVLALERLDSLLRAAPSRDGGQLLTPQALAEMGWTAEQADGVLRGLGFAPAGKAKSGELIAWRRRRSPDKPNAVRAAPTVSPFSALAALKAPQPAATARRRRRKPAKRTGKGAA
jgi:ATP-dependent RNA helicase SUPV3L1/SUV3